MNTIDIIKKNWKFLFLYLLILFIAFNVDFLRKDVEKIEEIKIDTLYIYIPFEREVTLTTYNPVEIQCDDSPLITANGTKINLEKLKKGEIKYCALSRDLLKEIPYGSIIYIEGFGEYEVVDTMNKRMKNTVDILQDINKKGFKKENVRILRIK